MFLFTLIVVAVGFIFLALVAWRFLTVRSKGAPVLFRRQGDGWRHGVVRYRGDNLECFKVLSLSPAADLTIDRCTTQVDAHRKGEEEQTDIIDDEDIILVLSNPAGVYEFALAHHAAKAIIAWIESAPSLRLERTDHKTLLMKAARKPRR